MLTVLSVLTALAVAVSLVADRMRDDIRPWAAEAERAQALYIAESGLAYQLYLEKWSDSSEPSFGPPSAEDSVQADTGLGFGEPGSRLGRLAPTDTFQFRLDTSLGAPRVKVDRTRAYLDMRSVAKYRQAEVTLRARFGKALDDSIFGPALTLDNDVVVDPFSPEQVQGLSRIRKPAPGMSTLPFLNGFSVVKYAAEFTDRMYYAADAALRKHLSDSAKADGNGHFTPRNPPRFGPDGSLAFPLGQADFINDGERTWVVKGPGRIYCDGEIRVKGKIRFLGIGLYSGKDIVFEDSVSGEEITVFARGNVFIKDRCNLSVEAMAGKNISLQNNAQTGSGSLLLSTGGKAAPASGGDSINASRVVNEAVARGFLIAAGDWGRVVMGTPVNRVEGVIIAASAWLIGEVDGPVLTRMLLCEGTNARNCLGPVRILRDRLPRDFIQPLRLGPQDRRAFAFRLMDWKSE